MGANLLLSNSILLRLMANTDIFSNSLGLGFFRMILNKDQMEMNGKGLL